MKEVLMPRLNEARRNELEAFWRAHLGAGLRVS